MSAPLKAPFPWFGGKSTVAADVWAAIGDVPNFVEPFAGSAAVLLARPGRFKTETINDADAMVANFWRALAIAPDEVARHADWPVNEVDLEARHHWLIGQRDGLRDLLGDPDAYDAKIAGWWVWGTCCWIGSGWCSGEGPWVYQDGKWVNRQSVHLGNAGRGINSQSVHLGTGGQGVNRQSVHLGDAGRGIGTPQHGYLQELAARLRHVRVTCGDFERVLGDSVTWRHGITGVFLDPPYAADRVDVYAHECRDVSARARTWAKLAGVRSDMRIVLAGYAGEHNELERVGWRVQAWKAKGGFGSQGVGRGRDNASAERLWFSPACLDPAQASLFGSVA